MEWGNRWVYVDWGLLYPPLWRFNVKSQCGSPEIPPIHEAILSRHRGNEPGALQARPPSARTKAEAY